MALDEPMTVEEWLEQSGRHTARDPHAWLHQASFLKAAGDAVWEDQQRLQHDLFRMSPLQEPDEWSELIQDDRVWTALPAAMLWGFAIENLLKGLIVARRDDAVGGHGLKVSFVWANKGHNLQWLADLANSTDLIEDQALLEKLGHLTRWSGRYPLPLNLNEQRPSRTPDGEPQGPKVLRSDEVALIQRMYARLHASLAEMSRVVSGRRRQDEREWADAQYRRLLPELEATHTAVSLPDGAIAYQSSERARTAQSAAIACAGCHAQFSVGRETKAVKCACENLHVARYRYDDAFMDVALDPMTLRRPDDFESDATLL